MPVQEVDEDYLKVLRIEVVSGRISTPLRSPLTYLVLLF